eukprot:CAMPEP_0185582352 /NCGR_PEP_ID=MMETSP0434-20130131/20541_1 /TAXON_ID=626734 ORGANISM="Favella taraikaensis, Strain Fe Narragansett Bay" /NCGR_SAMPLE_ID=MMETSP0434 /ASSEMBLY_ACC=CAM_ASM_000379 /LENGTH=78 /DNA_ID=CAMNT_0028201155 /DNA_START=32 /DNA_END=268 /DNA_ORIENTATION=+
MQDAARNNVDLYIPRKCSWTQRLITAKDHASVQINIGDVNEAGLYTGSFYTVALCGYIRDKGESDEALVALVAKHDEA